MKKISSLFQGINIVAIIGVIISGVSLYINILRQDQSESRPLVINSEKHLANEDIKAGDDTKASAKYSTCDAESVSMSRTGKVNTEITFLNQRDEPVKLYWLDYLGNRKSYGSIQSKDRRTQNTYVTHVWVVADTQDNCLSVYNADEQPRVVEIH
ncbi:MAG: hypothetical protein PUP92_07875 [Rhizonema sp. PD38]|nr:hypothetical protein [Rhizonema sp. PD38]